MSPCILSKKTGDSYMILLKDGLTINLPCQQGSQENSLGKRIFWIFNDAVNHRTHGDLACHAKEQKSLGC